MRPLSPARVFSVCVLILLPLCLSAQPAPQVRTAQGEVEGLVTPMGVLAFLGVPYAAPPLGELRWREPQPATAWGPVRNVKSYGPACMQPPSGAKIPPTEMSEDCLYLNVWTPSLKPSMAAPVMVFLHGGGFTIGSGSESGMNLAAHGAVVVTVNYRLGVFGFLAHPDLTAESPHHASGNYGLMDQIAALHWVRQNIAAFGGDARNITVFGESAGATAIGYLMVSPLATGAFDKAILESPSGLYTPDPELKKEVRGLTSMEEVGTAIAPTIAELRKLSANQMLARANSATEKLFGPGGSGHVRLKPEGHTQMPRNIDSPWWAFADGYVVPEQHTKLYEEGRGARIPIMVGTNTNEGSVFLGSFEPKTPEAFNAYLAQTFAPCGTQMAQLYSVADAKDIQSTADRLLTDAFFLYGGFSVARAQHGYLYRFSRVTPENANNKLGAFHGAEIPYVFGHTLGADLPYQPLDHKLSDQMMTAWIHFARTGDPRLMQSSQWTRIGSNGETPYMDFGDTSTVKDMPDTSVRVFQELWPPSGKAASCGKKR
jgi:para-nitrobenzyl esterase